MLANILVVGENPKNLKTTKKTSIKSITYNAEITKNHRVATWVAARHKSHKKAPESCLTGAESTYEKKLQKSKLAEKDLQSY